MSDFQPTTSTIQEAFLDLKALKRRGWTARLVSAFLGEPDDTERMCSPHRTPEEPVLRKAGCGRRNESGSGRLPGQKASQVVAKTMEEQRAAIQEIARLAFQAEASKRKEYRQSIRSRLMEHGITALAASGLTATFVYLLLRAH